MEAGRRPGSHRARRRARWPCDSVLPRGVRAKSCVANAESPEVLLAEQPVRVLLGRLHGPSVLLVGQGIPDTATAGTSEQPLLPPARLAAQEIQHRPRVGTLGPLLLGHGAALPPFLGTFLPARPSGRPSWRRRP